MVASASGFFPYSPVFLDVRATQKMMEINTVKVN